MLCCAKRVSFTRSSLTCFSEKPSGTAKKWNLLWPGHKLKGVRYREALRVEALQVARSKLDMDILCTGYESDEVETTVRLIEELKTL